MRAALDKFRSGKDKATETPSGAPAGGRSQATDAIPELSRKRDKLRHPFDAIRQRRRGSSAAPSTPGPASDVTAGPGPVERADPGAPELPLWSLPPPWLDLKPDSVARWSNWASSERRHEASESHELRKAFAADLQGFTSDEPDLQPDELVRRSQNLFDRAQRGLVGATAGGVASGAASDPAPARPSFLEQDDYAFVERVIREALARGGADPDAVLSAQELKPVLDLDLTPEEARAAYRDPTVLDQFLLLRFVGRLFEPAEQQPEAFVQALHEIDGMSTIPVRNTAEVTDKMRERRAIAMLLGVDVPYTIRLTALMSFVDVVPLQWADAFKLISDALDRAPGLPDERERWVFLADVAEGLGNRLADALDEDLDVGPTPGTVASWRASAFDTLARACTGRDEVAARLPPEPGLDSDSSTGDLPVEVLGRLVDLLPEPERAARASVVAAMRRQ